MSQQLVGNAFAVLLKQMDRTFQVDCVPEGDRGYCQVESAGAIPVISKVRSRISLEAVRNTIRKAHAVEPVTGDPGPLFPSDAGAREDKVPAVRGTWHRPLRLGIAGTGLPQGKIMRGMKFDDPNDLRKDFPRFTPEAMEPNFKVVDFLKDLAARKKSTPAQIALAWPLAQSRGSRQFRVPRKSNTWMTACPPPISG
jgi:hypothetical protein